MRKHLYAGGLTAALAVLAMGGGMRPAHSLGFVCDSVDGDGEGATAEISPNNVACGPSADASGNGSENLAVGAEANANSGNKGGSNVAVGNGANASGEGSANIATGDTSNASGNNSDNIATGLRSNASGNTSHNIASGFQANASGDASANIATGRDANASGNEGENIASGNFANASGDKGRNVASGRDANASGNSSRNIASGSQANASGDNSSNVAIGDSAFAAGDGGARTAVGAGARAEGANSSAIGAGAAATRDNQMAFGTKDSTYTMGGITSAASKAAQSGPVELVTTDAFGNLASDGGAIQRQINNLGQRDKKLADGIAVSLALAQPIFQPGQTFALRAGYGNFDGSSAFGVTAAGVLNRGWNGPGSSVILDAGIGVGLDQGTVAGRTGLSFGW